MCEFRQSCRNSPNVHPKFTQVIADALLLGWTNVLILLSSQASPVWRYLTKLFTDDLEVDYLLYILVKAEYDSATIAQ